MRVAVLGWLVWCNYGIATALTPLYYGIMDKPYLALNSIQSQSRNQIYPRLKPVNNLNFASSILVSSLHRIDNRGEHLLPQALSNP
jgi:hypothetical protein